jgi:Domain of unknown function (DUF4274)
MPTHSSQTGRMLNSSMGRDVYLEKISAERKQFILDMANDEWVDRLDEATKKDDAKFNALSEQMYRRRVTFLATASTPALELHCFADHWNWGGGTEAMRQVAEHPNCDAATALLLFWRSDPEYYLQFSSRDDVPDYNRDGFDLTRLIEERFLRGGYASSGLIGFNPREDVRIGEPVPGRRVIPVQLMQAVLAR